MQEGESAATDALSLLSSPEELKLIRSDSNAFLKKYAARHADYRATPSSLETCSTSDCGPPPSRKARDAPSLPTCPPSPSTRWSASTRTSSTS
jgi:hypothetical protein